ncbi:MAG: ATP-dependent 6-phosphofructokinase [Spirochaetales bacterium]|nr:ATP-dependent 6-phosphofructokinase [Spirochaetales bacterium]
MENLNIVNDDLMIEIMGKPGIPSPMNLSTEQNDGIADYVRDDETVLLESDRNVILEYVKKNEPLLAFEKAGPRQTIYYKPEQVKVAIVTCGGLCPGINNVIRSLVNELYYRYNVKDILGIRHGFAGFIPRLGYDPIVLTPEIVKEIHEKGGSILASSRGPQDIGEIVDFLEKRQVNILFTIGGDGTLQGAYEIFKEIRKRKRRISVIGVPKTIDNDIAYVHKTFGLETAFSVAAQAIRSAHTEAVGAPNGIGIVKVMGRNSGFIAANAALAINEVNFVLVPEIPFDLEGPQGLFSLLEARLKLKHHAVIIVAEGAGQNYVTSKDKDASGNVKLGDIGLFLRDAIKTHFKKDSDLDANIKYIDPSYLVRAVPANAHDAIYCIRLSQNAVHAAMAGKTGLLVGNWNSQFTHVPLKLATSQKKYLSPEEPLWLSVIEATGQPNIIKNE